MKSSPIGVCVLVLCLASSATGQSLTEAAAGTASPSAAASPVPTLIPLHGQLRTGTGQPRSGAVRLKVSLYAEQTDLTALWFEEHAVTLDANGTYDIVVGSLQSGGLPAELFAGGASRWLGIAVEQEPELPRLVLYAVPYASKAATSDTLSGRAISDFVLTDTLREQVSAAFGRTVDTKSPSLTIADGGATTAPAASVESLLSTENALVKYLDSAGSEGPSSVFEVGANLGVGTTTPGARLEVAGVIRSNGSPIYTGLAVQNAGVDVGFIGSEATWRGTGTSANLAIAAYGGNALKFYPNGGSTVAATIDTSGNLGVGTTTPGARLEVAGMIRSNGSPTQTGLAVQNAGVDVGFMGSEATWRGTGSSANLAIAAYGGNALQFYPNGGPTPAATIDTSGNLGVGTTTPGSRLEIAGMIRSNGSPTQTGLTVQNAGVDVGFMGSEATWRGTGTSANLAIAAYSGNALKFYPNAGVTEAATIDVSGNLGIGTSTPAAKLHVIGSGRFGGALDVTGDVTVTGNLTASGNIAAKYQDIAEWVDAAEPLSAGTVVAADPKVTNRVRRSVRAYDTAVLGVISAQPGVILGEPGDGKVAVAQSGRVKVKVDARYGAIKPGDLLVASPRAGYAMRSRPTRSGLHRPGTIIGKALEALPSGKGEILVLVTLQ